MKNIKIIALFVLLVASFLISARTAKAGVWGQPIDSWTLSSGPYSAASPITWTINWSRTTNPVWGCMNIWFYSSLDGASDVVIGAYSGTASGSFSFSVGPLSVGTHTIKIKALETCGCWPQETLYSVDASYNPVTFSVSNISSPTVDIKASGSDGPITIPYGTAVTLSWISANVTSCSLRPPFTTYLNGSQTINSVTTNFTQPIACSGPGGSVSDSVTVNVGPSSFLLSVTKSGTGSGTVTSNPAGINCGGTCSYSFNSNALITLTATADSDSIFSGWSGAGCSGTDPCTLTMDSAKTAQATFILKPANTLTVTKAGMGRCEVGDNNGYPFSCLANCSSASSGAGVYPATADVTLYGANYMEDSTPSNPIPPTPVNWSGGGSGCSGTSFFCNLHLEQTPNITVTCNPGASAPTVDLKVNGSDTPSAVNAPANLTVSWTTTDSNLITGNCTGTGQGWDGSKDKNGGTDSGGNLNGIATGTYTYAITCNKVDGGTITDSVSIIINPEPANCGTVQDADGNTYNTVVVGTQCWMAENLKVGTKLASSVTMSSDNGIIEKWCYDNNDANCAIEGGLYNWQEAMQYSATEGAQGICPSSWHIPTDAEQHTLENYLKDDGMTCDANRTSSSWDCIMAGTRLKSGGSSGMNFPITGYRNDTGACFFSGHSSYTTFWSSSEKNGVKAWHRGLKPDYSLVERSGDNKEYGFSVRCIKSSAPIPTVDLKVNNSDAPSAVNAPADLTVSWATTNSSELTSCTGTGQGWDGVKSVTGGNDSGGNLNDISTGNYTYTITCNKSGGGTITDSVNITIKNYSVTVSKSGTGSGTITSDPAGINCGGTCSANYNYNTLVTLTAAQSAGSTFAGWSGAGCSGTGDCTVTVDAAKSVTATFDLTPPNIDLKVNNSDAPSAVNAPANLNVSWTTTNPSEITGSCTGTGQGWDGPKNKNGGNDSGGNLNNISTGSYTYTITCDKVGGGTITDNVSIAILPPLNQAPVATNLSVSSISESDYCKIPAHRFSWTYSDPDGDAEAKFQLQVDSSSDFSSPEVDRTVDITSPSGATNIQQVFVAVSATADKLTYNETTYYWRVKVWDNNGLISAEANGTSFKTPKHIYPTVKFSASPSSPSANEMVQLTDLTTGEAAINGWAWSIADATYQGGTTANSQNPKVKFNSTGTKIITLTAKDADNYQCTNTDTASSLQNIRIKLSLPGWKEK